MMRNFAYDFTVSDPSRSIQWLTNLGSIPFYTDNVLSTWERIKKAFANDWEQTKADFSADDARDIGSGC